METRKTALMLVDIQPGFITDENKWIIPNIQKLLHTKNYDAYVEAVFSAPVGSLWDKQSNWTFPTQDRFTRTNSIFLPVILKAHVHIPHGHI
jgi:nicotinamidase-related amidase